MSDWYYRKSGAIRDETIGPIDTDTLARRLQRGEISPETLVSSPEKTSSKWVTIAAFPKLVEIHAEGVRARVRERERLIEAKREAKLAAKQERALAKQEKAVAKVEKQRQKTLARQTAIDEAPRSGELLPPQAASPFQPGAQPVPVQQPFVAQPAPQQIVNVVVNQPAQSNAVPVLLNFFLIPGLGQLVQGRVLAGILLMLCWGISLALIFVLIGFFLAPLVWIIAIVDAALYRG